MAESTQYLVFTIGLADAAQVATLQGGPPAPGFAVGAILAAPDAAAVTYSAPITVGEIVPPCIWSSWFKSDFPRNVASFDRKSGGWFGWSWLFGDTTHYKWRGEFQYVPPPGGPGGPAAPPNLCPRRWIDGFEFSAAGEGSSGIKDMSRMASRHVQGLGLAIRPGGVQTVQHGVSRLIGGANPSGKTQSWERFYVRLRGLPSTTTDLWFGHMSGNAGDDGLYLFVTATGQLALYAGPLTLIGTTAALALDVWVRVDLLFRFGPVATVPTMRLFLNGVEVLTFTASAGNALVAGAAQHDTSVLGPTRSGAHTLAMDVDDWMCADYPSVPQLQQGVDWNNGSAMLVVSPTGFDPSTAASWLGDWRTLLQNPWTGSETTLTSATNAARLAVSTDAADTLDALPGSVGIAALVVTLKATLTAGATLGYQLGAAADVVAAAVLSGVVDQYAVFWPGPGGPVALKPSAPLLLIHVHGAAGAAPVTTLGAVAEVLGVFGKEDLPVGVPVQVAPPVSLGPHNAPYPRTPWAQLTKPPIQPVLVVGGTYTGNGTAQDLAFSTPIHFLWIRPVTGDAGGTKWWSTLLGAHKAQLYGPTANLMVQAGIDAGFVPGAAGETPPSGTRTDLVRSVKAALVASGVSLVGDCGAFQITKRVAWALRTEGVGLLSKVAGANCGGYAVGILCWADGTIVDILGDAGGANTPQWAATAPIDPALYRPAIDPGDETTGGGTGTAQQQTVLRLVGNDTQNNAAGVVYSYLAIGDPGMRFLLNGGLTNETGAGDRLTALVHPTFRPLAGFVWPEVLDPGIVPSLHYKGPGHAAASLSPLTAGEVANSVAFGLASVTSQAAFHAAWLAQRANVPFSLWRMDDGSGHAGAVVQIFSYTGNGVASRSMAIAPASGKRPLFALIVPHNGMAYMRDSAHLGTTSSKVDGTPDAATGITGGDLDTIVVGSALNTNGIVYDVCVVPGGVDGCNGGFSCPGTFVPVPPEPPPDGPQPPPDPPEPPPDGPPDGPPVDPNAPPVPGIPATCLAATTLLVNIALSRIGVTQYVGDLALDQTNEAIVARLHYTEELEATLRAFPWPFATRYATLVRIAGTSTVPVNGDWQYAYRAPADMVFARRLVGVAGQKRAFDPNPTTFRIGSDATGPLLYTDDAAGTLEYTVRPVCAASSGDGLFRTALSWRLASALAPGLSRDDKKTQFCLSMFLRTIAQAEVAAANEAQPDGDEGEPDWIRDRN